MNRNNLFENFQNVKPESEEDDGFTIVRNKKKEDKKEKTRKEQAQIEYMVELRPQYEEYLERLDKIKHAYGEEWIYIVQGNEYWDCDEARDKRRKESLRDPIREAEARISARQEIYGYSDDDCETDIVSIVENNQQKIINSWNKQICRNCQENDERDNSNWCDDCLMEPNICYFNNYIQCLNLDWSLLPPLSD